MYNPSWIRIVWAQYTSHTQTHSVLESIQSRGLSKFLFELDAEYPRIRFCLDKQDKAYILSCIRSKNVDSQCPRCLLKVDTNYTRLFRNNISKYLFLNSDSLDAWLVFLFVSKVLVAGLESKIKLLVISITKIHGIARLKIESNVKDQFF